MENNMEFVYKFPVVKGIQAGREYYIAMVPMKMIPRLFSDIEDCVPPEYRAQRKLNESRIPIISKYILSNRDNYVFSALAASIDGEYVFTEVKKIPNIGVLEVSMDATFLINDGQHRKAAILDALKEDESLGEETIPIVFFSDMGLERSQQIFTDLNKNAVKTSNSISELYDSRDEVAVLTRTVIYEIPFLNKYTDKEKDNLGKYSSKLFTLNMFYTANKSILSNKTISEADQDFILLFWKNVVKNMTQWIELEKREITKIDLRENYIACQGIVLQAIARIGAFLLNNPDYDLEKRLEKLQEIDWSRTNFNWKMRAINEKGRIITKKSAALLIANVLKLEMGLPLNEQEETAERNFYRLYADEEHK